MYVEIRSYGLSSICRASRNSKFCRQPLLSSSPFVFAARLCQTALFIYTNVRLHFSWLDCIRYRTNRAWDVYSLIFIPIRFISKVKRCGTERVCQRDKAEQETSRTLHSAKQAAPDIGVQFANVHVGVRGKNRGVWYHSLVNVCTCFLCKYVTVLLVPCHRQQHNKATRAAGGARERESLAAYQCSAREERWRALARESGEIIFQR